MLSSIQGILYRDGIAHDVSLLWQMVSLVVVGLDRSGPANDHT